MLLNELRINYMHPPEFPIPSVITNCEHVLSAIAKEYDDKEKNPSRVGYPFVEKQINAIKKQASVESAYILETPLENTIKGKGGNNVRYLVQRVDPKTMTNAMWATLLSSYAVDSINISDYFQNPDLPLYVEVKIRIIIPTIIDVRFCAFHNRLS